MEELLQHGFKLTKDIPWTVFEKQISEFKHIRVYKHEDWNQWGCELIQEPPSKFHEKKVININSDASPQWVELATRVLQEGGDIF